MAAVMVATYLDGFAWQRRVEQVELRAHAGAAEARAARLEQEVREMAQEIEDLQKRLCASQDSEARLRLYLSSPVSPDEPMPRAMAPAPCGVLAHPPAE
jgi:sensor c-di-GMP phosphodiesterase-like protein